MSINQLFWPLIDASRVFRQLSREEEVRSCVTGIFDLAVNRPLAIRLADGGIPLELHRPRVDGKK